MKKLLVIALSAMMLFAFTACNNGGRSVNTLDAVVLTTANSGDDAVWSTSDVKPDDFSSELSFDETGLVTGTLKPVTGFTAFNSTEVDEQSGYYFGIKIETKELDDATMTLSINGQSGEGKTDMAFDDQIIFRVADLPEGNAEPVLTGKTCKVEVTSGTDTYEASFDLSGVTLEKPVQE